MRRHVIPQAGGEIGFRWQESGFPIVKGGRLWWELGRYKKVDKYEGVLI